MYQLSWVILTLLYSNPRTLRVMHMKRLTELPVTKQTSVSELKRLMDTSRVSIRSLGSIGKPLEAWDDWFVIMITLSCSLHKFFENPTKLIRTQIADRIFHPRERPRIDLTQAIKPSQSQLKPQNSAIWFASKIAFCTVAENSVECSQPNA